MNLEDLVLPDTDNPLALRGALHPHPGAKAVYDLMERTAHHLLAVAFMAWRAGKDENLIHRCEFRTELARAEFAHIKITKGPNIASRMIPAHDRDLVRRRALAITHATAASQERQK